MMNRKEKLELKEKKKKEKLDKKKEKKGIWERMFNSKRIERKGKVAVLLLKNTNRAEPIEVKSKSGFFVINNKLYHEDRDCVYSMGKERTPLAIIPEWSMLPLGNKNWQDKEMIEKFSALEDHVLKGIRRAELVRQGDKDISKEVDLKKWIIGGLALLVGGIILKGYI
jgi:hypothetical protein